MSNAELGPVISEHPGRFAAGGLAWYVGGIVFVSSIIGIGKEAIAGNWINIPFFLLVAGAAGLWLFYNFTRWKQKIVLHANGFVWTRIVRKPVTVFWTDVASAHVSRHGSRQAMHLKGLHVEVELSLRSGGRVVVSNDMDGVETIASYASAPAEAGPPPASPWGAPT